MRLFDRQKVPHRFFVTWSALPTLNAPLFLRGQNLLRAHLVDQVVSSQVGKMRSLFVVREICANSSGHYYDERLIRHVHPVAAPNELTNGIPHKRTVWFNR
jgi:hypothetical protein